ncbi:receptor-like protein kinase [Cinnamomum micranthum f. kanehirae]|uniref:Receptor-like protein kinase n=1 Tax=Cinnamomum micranthum f. kanehirae TaxID=337451 RepID=A0A443NI35_9MAGN|nr:receptor-like protein kinase [Cinnamomum micranthum f. kanehirae]
MRAQFNRFSTTISFYVLKSLLRSLVSGKKIQTFGRGCSVREMTLVWSCFWFMVSLLTLALLVHGQPGFVSIDCGIANDSNGYIENDITYISDAQFIETGVNENVRINRKELLRLYRTVRSFPDGKRNCYKLGSLNKSNKYLIRASFMYGDYDGKNMTPKFDLYIGASRGITISFSNATDSTYEEIIIVATMNFISFCLVNTGYGTPFISGLKLRPLANTIYPDDSFDRYWWPKEDASWTPLRTLQNVTNKDKATEPPSTVMMTAVCPLNNSDALYFNWTVDDSSQQFHVYMHFAELELLGSNMTREFTACCSNNTCYNSPIRPEYHVTTTVQTSQPLTGQYNYYCSIKKTPTSTLPPILNAIEIFTILQLTEKPTREDDVEAMVDIKATYKMKRNWMGDPCLPEIYKWEGLTCSNNQSDAPAVVSLNLSSAGLKGKIAASLSNLKSIQSLDLSWNNLIGPVPNFLGDLPFLLSLDLSGNQLSGLIPSNLIEKSKRGSLKLSLDGNPDLCVPGSCSRHSSKRKITILIAASVASVVILSILLIILRRFKWRKEDPVVETNNTGDALLSEGRQIISTNDPVVDANNIIGRPLLLEAPSSLYSVFLFRYDTSKHLTKKSDVYSFGVVLFRLITALPATIQRNGTDKIDLVDWANRTIALAPIEGVVDPKLEGVHDANSLEKAAEIARLCTSKKPEERPTMFEVVAKLKDCLETEAAAKRIRDLVNIEQQVE